MLPCRNPRTIVSTSCGLALAEQAGTDAGRVAPSRFWFIAGHVALDFVNTELVHGGALVDQLPTDADLAAWVWASSLGRRYGRPREITRAVFAESIELRRVLRAGFGSLIAGRPVPDLTVATLNDILRTGPGAALRRGGDGSLAFGLRVRLDVDSRPIPWLIADAAARLIADAARERATDPAAGRLRRCAGGDCAMVFLDTSRSRTRRWCSMERCGNRNKVAAHSARARLLRPARAPDRSPDGDAAGGSARGPSATEAIAVPGSARQVEGVDDGAQLGGAARPGSQAESGE